MKRRFELVQRVVACIAIAALAGCGAGGKAPPEIGETVPVSGTVMLDGNPVEGAGVSFIPQEASGFQGAFGTTDASGKYELEMPTGKGRTEKKKGTVPGKYKVTVSKWALPSGEPVPKEGMDPNEFLMKGARESLPMKTANNATTNIEFNVTKGGGGPYDINLKSQ